MKAARLHAYHEPLKLDEIEEPKADGPLDVVVRTGAAGLRRTDLHIQDGQWAKRSGVKLPYTPGHESAVGAGAGFDEAFPGEAAGVLDELRELFRRKALVVRQGRLCNALLRGDTTAERLAAMRLVDLPDGPDGRRCRALRGELGLRATPESPAFVLADGSALVASQVPRFMRVARLVRLSLEGNGGLCRGLLKTRYGIEDPEEVAA